MGRRWFFGRCPHVIDTHNIVNRRHGLRRRLRCTSAVHDPEELCFHPAVGIWDGSKT
jgi:hypothetical protein